MIFPTLFWTSWTGIILPGRLTNTSMPSRLASAHLLCWHHIQIHMIRALLYKFKWFLEGILSLRQRDLQKLPLESRDTQLPTQKRNENRNALGNIRAFPLKIMVTNFLPVDSQFPWVSPKLLPPHEVLLTPYFGPLFRYFSASDCFRTYIYSSIT